MNIYFIAIISFLVGCCATLLLISLFFLNWIKKFAKLGEEYMKDVKGWEEK